MAKITLNKNDDYETRRNLYKSELLSYITKHRIVKQAYITWKALSFSLSTAKKYDLLHDPEIEEQLQENRNMYVNSLLAKWVESDNPTLQIAAMKIVCDDYILNRLDVKRLDVTTKGDKVENEKLVILVSSEKTANQIKDIVGGDGGQNEDNEGV